MNRLVTEGIAYPFPATSVANTVTYVDEEVYSPKLNFVYGHPTPFAYQLSLGKYKAEDAIIYLRPAHTRASLIMGNARILRCGQLYNYVDCKGIGYMEGIKNDGTDPRFRETTWRFYASPSRVFSHENNRTYGAVCLNEAEEERVGFYMVEEFGSRTAPIIAEARLHEVLDKNGEKISIAEAKDRLILSPAIDAGLVFRAWVTPHRAADIEYSPENEVHRNLTPLDIQARRSAIFMAMEDIHAANPWCYNFDSVNDYLEWLVRATSRELAVLHRNNTIHGNLTPHNITLDGRLVDYDSIEIDVDPFWIAYERDRFFKNDNYFFVESIASFGHLGLTKLHHEALLHLAYLEYQKTMGAV